LYLSNRGQQSNSHSVKKANDRCRSDFDRTQSFFLNNSQLNHCPSVDIYLTTDDGKSGHLEYDASKTRRTEQKFKFEPFQSS
jgi:hypothetical protein